MVTKKELIDENKALKTARSFYLDCWKESIDSHNKTLKFWMLTMIIIIGLALSQLGIFLWRAFT